MRIPSQLLSSTILFLLVACTSAKQVSDVNINREKLNGRSFQKIFVVGATKDIEVRNDLESEFALEAKARGYSVVKSLDMIPYSLDSLLLPTKEQIEMKVKETGCDAILIVSLVKQAGAVEYTAGVHTKKNDQFLGSLLAEVLKKDAVNSKGELNYNNNIERIPAIDKDGQFSKQKDNFFLQSNLCDALDQQLLCTEAGKPLDLSSLRGSCRNYCSYLIGEFEKEKLIRK